MLIYGSVKQPTRALTRTFWFHNPDMSTDDDPQLAERIDRMFIGTVLDRVENSVVGLGLVCIGVRVWRTGQAAEGWVERRARAFCDRPEIDLVVDLVLSTAVALVLDQLLRIGSRELIGATHGSGTLPEALEMLQWAPLLLLLVYQLSRFSRELRRRWSEG